MERASRVLTKLKVASSRDLTPDFAAAAWTVAVGKTIARHSSAIGLVGQRLVVEVEDAVWQRQLWALRGQILRSLDKALGHPPIVTELEFRIAGPRRKPVQVADERQRIMPQQTDEADSIRDPIFRSIYRASRRAAREKATA